MVVALPLSSLSPISTFTDLREQVADRLMRLEVDITSPFPLWLSMVESEINRRLALDPVRPQQTISTATIDSDIIAQPASLLDIECLMINGVEVLPTTAQSIAAKLSADDTEGQPQYYALIGSQIQFYPTPDDSYSAVMTWWTKVPPLTDVNVSNWLMVSHADVYWHGVLAHGYQHFLDEEKSQIHVAYFSDALDKVLSAYPARPDRGGLVSDINPTALHTWGLLA